MSTPMPASLQADANRGRPAIAHAALTVLRAEHAALRAVLRALEQLTDESQPEVDFGLLRAMLFYVDEFPEQRHHRRESELLFPRLRARVPAARRVLDQLEEDHLRGERRIRDLQHALLAWEILGPARRDDFRERLHQYVDFYLEHMRVEETQVLPLAGRHLDDHDWAALDVALAGHRDALAGQAPDAPYHALFRRIVHHVPVPLGLGPAGRVDLDPPPA